MGYSMGCSPTKEPPPPALQTYTAEKPWINTKGSCGPEKRQEFYSILTSGLQGAQLSGKNLYLVFGFASQGYAEEGPFGWPDVQKSLEAWCQQNDERHKADGTGWILMTQGDGDYGIKSIESIAQYVSKREPKTPVVFIQSHLGYAEPGSKYWPTYASAGYFGEGVYHNAAKLDKEGNPRVGEDGSPMLQEAWGGYVKGATGERTGAFAFPDDAIHNQTFGNDSLAAHLGGVFVAGGGAITEEQVEMYELFKSSRQGDCFQAAVTKDGNPSNLNEVYVTGDASAQARTCVSPRVC